MKHLARTACFLVLPLAVAVCGRNGVAKAEPPPSVQASRPERTPGRGVAVVALGDNAREEAFAAARAIYGSSLRPPALDEVRARVLAGGPPPATASHELRDLAEIRASIAPEDAVGRRLLSGIATQFGVEALLVVKVEAVPKKAGDADAGVEGGALGNAEGSQTVTARLFLATANAFDAARYSPDDETKTPASWKSTVLSLEGRFPTGSRSMGPATALQPTPVLHPEPTKSSPFYASGWFWGAVGGAALLGGTFYLLSRDTGGDSIHLQMRVPK